MDEIDSCITGKAKLETYQIYNLQADKQLNETWMAIYFGISDVTSRTFITESLTCQPGNN